LIEALEGRIVPERLTSQGGQLTDDTPRPHDQLAEICQQRVALAKKPVRWHAVGDGNPLLGRVKFQFCRRWWSLSQRAGIPDEA